MSVGAPTQIAFPPVRTAPLYAVGRTVTDPAPLRLVPQHKRVVISSAGMWPALPLGR